MHTLPVERIKYLLQRYVAETLTMEERQELSHLVQLYPQVWGMLEEMEANGEIPTAFQEKEEAEIERGIASVSAVLRQQENKPVSWKSRLAWISFAAAVLTGLAFGIAAILKSKASRSPGAIVAALPIRQEFPPGRIRALLTRSDGRSIWLDSLGNGKLPMEDGRGSVKGDPIEYRQISTPKGGRYDFTLPDGTMAYLNDHSRIFFPTVFSGKDRLVMTSGEVLFDVKKNPSQPFKVLVDGLQIDVLGTSFNIRAYERGQAVTTVLDGKVRVCKGDRKQDLKAKEQVSVSESKPWVLEKDVNTDGITDWKNGGFCFTGLPLSTILPQLERRYDIEIENRIPDDPVYHLLIPPNPSLSRVLNDLEIDNPNIHFTINGRKLIVYN